jgi:hypothetical protein
MFISPESRDQAFPSFLALVEKSFVTVEITATERDLPHH